MCREKENKFEMRLNDGGSGWKSRQKDGKIIITKIVFEEKKCLKWVLEKIKKRCEFRKEFSVIQSMESMKKFPEKHNYGDSWLKTSRLSRYFSANPASTSFFLDFLIF